MRLVTLLVFVAVGAAGAAGLRSQLLARHARMRLAAAARRGRHVAAPPSPAGTTGLVQPELAGGDERRSGPRRPLAAGEGLAAGSFFGERSVGEIATAGALGAAVGVGVVTAIGPVVLVIGAMAGVAAPVALRSHRATERRRLRGTQLPSALDRLATALRAGSPVPMAMVEAGTTLPAPVGPELVALGREADAGRAIAEVLDGWSERHDDAGTRLAATALALATTVGGAAGRAVDGVAATLRERLDLADERRSLASQARLSALVLAVAPVGFAVLLGAADSSAADFLLGTPPGWACLCAGLALDGAGAWWMARLTRGSET